VERCAAGIGVLKGSQPYTPHLTLARIKPSKDGNAVAAFRQMQKKRMICCRWGVPFR
jgi:2'-5' RNA ligase